MGDFNDRVEAIYIEQGNVQVELKICWWEWALLENGMLKVKIMEGNGYC